MTWPPTAWAAINHLAETDLAGRDRAAQRTGGQPVSAREPWLSKARTARVNRHRAQIDAALNANPAITTPELIEAITAPSQPPSAQRRDYDAAPNDCQACDRVGWIPADDNAQTWTRCPACSQRLPKPKKGPDDMRVAKRHFNAVGER